MPILAPQTGYPRRRTVTGGFWSDLGKGTANLFTAGHAYPKSGPMGTDGKSGNLWGAGEALDKILPDTHVTECLLDQWGNRVTDCPNPIDSPDHPSGVCCPTGVTAYSPTLMDDTVSLHGQKMGGTSTKAAVEAATKAKQAEIEKHEGKKTPFILHTMPILAPGIHLSVAEAAAAPTTAPPVEVPVVVHQTPEQVAASAKLPAGRTAILAGGAFLAAFLLIRGMRE